MRTEQPQLRRCCFCLPLRHGLLAWGYLKLVCNLLFTGYIIIKLTIHALRYGETIYSESSWIFAAIIMVLLIETGMSLVFVIGGHTKKFKLIRIYYYYEIVILVIFLGLILYNFIIEIIEFGRYGFLYIILYYGAFVPVFLIVSMYLLLLIRSEMIKFRESCKFEFSNNAAAAEAQCNLIVN